MLGHFVKSALFVMLQSEEAWEHKSENVEEQSLVGLGHKSGLVISGLDSQSKGCGFESCLIQYTRWEWLMSKPCQDWFLHPILVYSWNNKKNIGSQMGQKNI